MEFSTPGTNVSSEYIAWPISALLSNCAKDIDNPTAERKKKQNFYDRKNFRFRIFELHVNCCKILFLTFVIRVIGEQRVKEKLAIF